MPTTPYNVRCEILGSLWLYLNDEALDEEGWNEFFAWANIGLVLAYAQWQLLATVKADGKAIINETWDAFCGAIQIDNTASYTSLEDAFSASPDSE